MQSINSHIKTMVADTSDAYKQYLINQFLQTSANYLFNNSLNATIPDITRSEIANSDISPRDYTTTHSYETKGYEHEQYRTT